MSLNCYITITTIYTYDQSPSTHTYYIMMPFYTSPPRPPNVSCNLYIVYVVFLILLF